MAGLTKRIYITGGVILLAGIGIQLAGKAEAKGRDEAFMIKSAPLKVGEFEFQTNDETPGKSYTADDRTYSLLKPFGIVPRIYTNGSKAFEVLLISSSTKESFHDQDVCFPGQGLNPVSKEIIPIEAGDRGTIPVRYVVWAGRNGEQLISAQFYRGPGGVYYPEPGDIAKSMLWNAITGGRKNPESNYYRFIPQYRDATKEETLAFIKAYLQEAAKTSQGFF